MSTVDVRGYYQQLCASVDTGTYHVSQEFLSKMPPSPIYSILTPSISVSSAFKEGGVFARITSVWQRVVGIIGFPVFWVRSLCHRGAQWCREVAHDVIGWSLMPAALKSRYAVLRFVENWPLNLFYMGDSGFSLGVLPSLSQLRPTKISDLCPLPGFLPRKLGDWELAARDKSLDARWHCKRFSVGLDDTKIDALFMGRVPRVRTVTTGLPPWRTTKQEIEPVERKRVILYAPHQGEMWEAKLFDRELRTLAEKMDADVVVWNPPGVGGSTGKVGFEGAAKACRAMVQFLEQWEVPEIVYYGHSMGGTLLLKALKGYPLDPSKRHLCVLRHCSTSLQRLWESSAGALRCVASWLAWAGWEMDNSAALNQLQVPALLIHTALGVEEGGVVSSADALIPDTFIEDTSAMLGHRVLSTPPRPHTAPQRRVVGVSVWHDEPLTDAQIACVSDEAKNFLI